MDFRDKYIELEVRRVADVARDRFAAGVAGVLALGFLEGALLADAAEAQAMALARADAHAAAASTSTRLSHLATEGLSKAELAAAASLKHRLREFVEVRLLVAGRHSLVQLLPSLVGAASLVDGRSRATLRAMEKTPAAALRLRWLAALRCAVGLVTGLSTLCVHARPHPSSSNNTYTHRLLRLLCCSF